jgi:hypothetical protein
VCADSGDDSNTDGWWRLVDEAVVGPLLVVSGAAGPPGEPKQLALACVSVTAQTSWQQDRTSVG